MKVVKFQELKPKFRLADDIARNIQQVSSSGRYLFGPQSLMFAKKFCRYIGPKMLGVPVANGTDALIICLKTLGIKDGDHVLVPSHAPLPVWMAVTNIRAIPIPIPFNDYLCTSIDYFENTVLGKRVISAMIVVHLYGLPDHIHIIKRLVRNRFPIIEDCCQAHGATFHDVRDQVLGRVGSVGDMAAFSFYPTKNLGGFGDSGMVMSQDEDKVELAKRIAFYGDKRSHAGINSRMDEIQATILLAKLEYLNEWNAQRRENAQFYRERLEHVDFIKLPYSYPGHVYHQFVIRTPYRDQLRDHLLCKGIETMIHYSQYPLQMPFYVKSFSAMVLAKKFHDELEILAGEVLSLPIAPHLLKNDIDYVCDVIEEFEPNVH